jgi:NADP-dependent 3-hydroxy acid dehydrogenase YdfG
MNLILTGRRADALEDVAVQCRAEGAQAQVLAGDLTDTAFVQRLSEAAAHVQVLVNNAGILTYAPVLNITTEQCAQMFATNVVAAFDLTRAMAAHMAKRGSGHLVFITSGAARSVAQHGVVYAATKHALSAFAKGFRLELKSHRIKVSEIAPGMVDTDIRQSSTHPEVIKSLAARKFAPLRAQEVADALLFALVQDSDTATELIELRPAFG